MEHGPRRLSRSELQKFNSARLTPNDKLPNHSKHHPSYALKKHTGHRNICFADNTYKDRHHNLTQPNPLNAVSPSRPRPSLLCCRSPVGRPPRLAPGLRTSALSGFQWHLAARL
jgi:hypothetical protein